VKPSSRLCAVGEAASYQRLLSLPYLVTIMALALAARNAAYPAALLKPYKREA
jgi:simple sugar transport system permease protein